MYNNNYGYQQPYQYSMNKSILKGHPVSSLEEVRATGIDFDGSIAFFPDIANKRIYTKQINLDGTATLNMYELTQIPEAPTTGNFITREEFNTALAALKESMKPEQPAATAKQEPAKPQANFSF